MRRHHRNRLIFAAILILIIVGIVLLVRFIINQVSNHREADTNVRTVHIDLTAELEKQADGAQLQNSDNPTTPETPVTPPTTEAPTEPVPTLDPYRTYNDLIDEEGYTQLNDYEGVQRTEDVEVLKSNLRIYAEKDPRANILLEDAEQVYYPLLRLAGNNPMTIGPVLEIINDEDPALDDNQGETIALNRPAPFFLQWDRRWAGTSYGDGYLMLNGCVPVTLSMAISGVTDQFVSPEEIISHAGPDDIGEWGTSWSFVDRIPGVYGVGVVNIPYDQWSVNQALDEGKVILVSLGPGRFTFVGHFVAIVDYDEEGYIINDPNSLENTLQKWAFEEIGPVSNVWAIG